MYSKIYIDPTFWTGSADNNVKDNDISDFQILHWSGPLSITARLNIFEELVPETTNMLIDLGCGCGHLLEAWLTKSPMFKALGVEYSLNSLKRASKRLSLYQTQHSLIYSTIPCFLESSSLFDINSVDTLVCLIGVLQNCMVDPFVLLTSICKSLKFRHLFLTTKVTNDKEYLSQFDPYHERHSLFYSKELYSCFEQNNLTCIKQKPIFVSPKQKLTFNYAFLLENSLF